MTPLYGLASVSTPFAPALTSQPDGWEMALNFNDTNTGASFDVPTAMALDAYGDVFVANYEGGAGNLGSVSELTAVSNYRTGVSFDNSNVTGSPSGPTVFALPSALAVDELSNVFVANFIGGSDYVGSVSELSAGDGYTTASISDNSNASGASFDHPGSIALDVSSNVFVANGEGNSVSELTEPSYTTGQNFTTSGASLDYPQSIALDRIKQRLCGECGRRQRGRADGARLLHRGLPLRPLRRGPHRARRAGARRIKQHLCGGRRLWPLRRERAHGGRRLRRRLQLRPRWRVSQRARRGGGGRSGQRLRSELRYRMRRFREHRQPERADRG